jgi:hypothetical protein
MKASAQQTRSNNQAIPSEAAFGKDMKQSALTLSVLQKGLLDILAEIIAADVLSKRTAGIKDHSGK